MTMWIIILAFSVWSCQASKDKVSGIQRGWASVERLLIYEFIAHIHEDVLILYAG